MNSHLIGQLAAAFVICECFNFWHLVKLAEANQAKDFPATRRLTPAYAQRFVPSINSKRNSGVNPKDRPNFRRLCLSWRVSQRGKEWLWLTLGTQTLVAAIPGSCPQHMYTHVDRHHQGILSSVHYWFSPSTKKKKTTEKIFIINHEANHTEIFLISRNEVKHCPLNPSSLTYIYDHMYLSTNQLRI